MNRSQVFISYSHADSEYLSRLRIHLRPFERKGFVDVWADTKIKSGQRWKQEIENALDCAAVAILLVSADFLASDFVVENELPPLLMAAKEKGVKILPVILKPCAFADTDEISQFQAVNDPRKPVISLDEGERENLWYSVASSVKKELESKKQVKKLERVVTRENFPKKENKTYTPDDYYGLFAEELQNPSTVDDFFVYEYQHLDELSLLKNPENFLGSFSTFDKLMEKIRVKFKSHGWEGDGVIKLMWLPPFLGAGIEDTYGIGVWHVKQSNNGTSFLASPVPLPFSRLLEQNH